MLQQTNSIEFWAKNINDAFKKTLLVLKNKERKCHFRFVERRFLAAINCTGSAEGALVPVLLRITHWPKSGLPVSPPGLFPPWCEYSKKRGKTERGMARRERSNSEKSSGSLNCFSFLTGLGFKAKSTKCKSAILICSTAFSSDYPPISDLIHLARCVKFNP